MSVLQELKDRSGNQCELCTSNVDLKAYELPPVAVSGIDVSLLACEICIGQIEFRSLGTDTTDVNHWRCLNDSMWSEYDAVKVIASLMLSF
jgi:protein PhnA